MITEAILRFFLGMLGHLVGPIFDNVYAGLGIDPAARFMIPSPLWFVVEQTGVFATLMSPFALAYWAWRQIKA